MANLKNFSDFLNYYKQTGKLPSGIDQPTMDAANSNAEMLGIPAETTQIPFAPENQLPSLSNNIVAGDDATPKFEDKAKAITANATNVKAPAPNRSAETQAAGMGQIQAAVNPSEDKEMEAAQDAARHNKAMAMGLEASRIFSEGLGSLGAGSNVALNDAGASMLMKNAEAPVQEIAAAREQLAKKMSLTKESDRMNPTSNISKMAQLLAIRAGMNPADIKGKSAVDLDDNMKTIMAIRQLEGQEKDRALQREVLASNRQNKFEEGNKDDQNRYLQYAQTQMKDVVDNYRKIRSASDTVKTMTGKNPAEQISALYQYVKALDPNSAVREGEVALAQSITSAQGKVETAINKITQGQAVDKQTLDNIKHEIVRLEKQASDSYNARADMYRTAAKNRNIPSERFAEFDPISSQSAEKAVSATKGTVDSKTLNDYATKHNVTPEKAKELLSKAGYNVE